MSQQKFEVQVRSKVVKTEDSLSSVSLFMCVFVCVYLQLILRENLANHIFRLTGPGADQDPKGLFIIDIDTGDVSVSRSLDREAVDSYQVCVCVCYCLISLLLCLGSVALVSPSTQVFSLSLCYVSEMLLFVSSGSQRFKIFPTSFFLLRKGVTSSAYCNI